VIARRAWNAEAERDLARSAGRDMAVIRRQVQADVAMLWECESDRNHAWCVTRLDADEAGAEWVIVLFEGSGLHEFVPLFVEAADSRGLPLRAHLNARRPGLKRMAARYGFEVTELVVRRRDEQ
jgi:hypothetical protein